MDDLQGLVERVKAATRIEEIVEATGPEFEFDRRHGRYLRCKQPHNDLVIRTDEGYYVWNKQNEKGDVFNWLERRNGWDFWECLRYLAERAKIEIPEKLEKGTPESRAVFKAQRELLGIAAEVLHQYLLKDADALGYARGRGWSDETIKACKLGFTGRSPAAAAKDIGGEFALYGVDPESKPAVSVIGFKGDVTGWCQRHGVPVNKDWVEWGMVPGMVGRKRLVYVHMEGGKAVYLTGRNILGDETNREGRTVKSYNLPRELAGERRVYFNQEYGRKAERCVVVEGQADAITWGQWGMPAVALCGTQWLDHEGLLRELRERHGLLYLGMDQDEAGVKALVGNGDWPLGRWAGGEARVVDLRLETP